jgi:putative inorganic carbon (hco3(-)) transporter
MRDLFIVVTVFGSVPAILVRPQIGILMWYWISLMNPHRLSWGYAYQLRVAFVVGAVTILAWLFSSVRKLPPGTATNWLIGALAFWVTVTTCFAIVPESAVPKWQEVIKILAMTFLATCIVDSKERIVQTVWVVAMSLALYGVKGGIFSVLTGGSYRVWGPPDTFIADNNALGLALIMILPLLHFLSLQAANRWIRLALLAAMAPTIVAILCTYSRGAFLALSITLFAFWIKAKRRMLTGTIAVAVVAATLSFLPASWYDRMSTIEDYQQDESANGRLNSWYYALLLAGDRPLTGGGFRVVDDTALYFRYLPDAEAVHNFHSIYFEALGEHGYVGLVLFLALLFAALGTAQRLIRAVRGRPDLEWAGQLASAIQVSVVGYCSAGAFLNLGFYDLLYALLALLTSTNVVVTRALAADRRGAPAGGFGGVAGAAAAAGRSYGGMAVGRAPEAAISVRSSAR